MARAARQRSYRLGIAAELLAALVLTARGYRVLALRYKTPVGEIDLIVRRGRTVAFVEVKARAGLAQALSAAGPRTQSRVARAAQYFLAQKPGFADCELRFDLFAVASPFCWRHLDNAWRPSS